jgi:hypothetical protein
MPQLVQNLAHDAALVRLRLGHSQIVPAMKVIPVIQPLALVEDDEDLPLKSVPTG